MSKDKRSTFLIHYGELGLKGQNRRDFESKLKKNIEQNLSRDGISAKVSSEHRYFILKCDSSLSERVIPVLDATFGISWYTEAHILPRTSKLTDIEKELLSIATTRADPSKTLKIKVKRADKTYPQNSPEIEKNLGATLLKKTTYEKVDLKDPDDEYLIEIAHEHIFIFTEKHRGPGGLPVGTGGNVLVLLSGGFDSPVAAYLMAKRGCTMNYLHFYVNEPKRNGKIPRIVRQLSKYTGPSELHLAPYLPFNMAILDTKTRYELVLFRRFMLRIAEELCRKHGYDAIITGDSLGQVASQTMENLSATQDALESTPILRPLISFDKEEIIEIAKRIGTFDISNEPEKDCCSIIDRNAKTRVTVEKIQEEEKGLQDYRTIIEETLSSTSTIPS